MSEFIKLNRGSRLNRRSSLKFIPLFVATMMTLSGCGASKTPSSSDIKNQLQDAFKNCSIIQISQLEKTNGFDQGNGHYLVNVKFSVKTTPLPEVTKILEAAKPRSEELKLEIDRVIPPAEARFEVLKEERSALSNKQRKELDELENQARAAASRINERLAAEGKKNTRQDPEILALVEAYERDRSNLEAEFDKLIEKNETEQKALVNKINSLKDEYKSLVFDKNDRPYPDPNPMNPTSLRGKMVLAFAKACMLPDSSLVKDIKNKIYVNLVPYVESTETEFTADIQMLKTDNGWVVQQLYK